MSEYASLSNALACVRKKTDFEPKVALVLGSGLGGFAQNIREEASVAYSEIEGFPVSTEPGMRDGLFSDILTVRPWSACRAGYIIMKATACSRCGCRRGLMRLLGAEILFLTNASGGISPDFYAGAAGC